MADASRRTYPPDDRGVHPPWLFPPYTATVSRAPHLAPLNVDPTATELAVPPSPRGWPVGGDDLTTRRGAPPIGERIIVAGRVSDAAGEPVPGAVVEVWQANSAGRYVHAGDRRSAPVDPNFTGTGRCLTADDGTYRFVTIRPGAYPGRSHHNAWRPPHIHFSVIGGAIVTRLVTQMYFPGDPLLDRDTIFLAAPESTRDRLLSSLDLDLTEPDVSLGYRFDLVLRGRAATPQVHA